jgi:DNA-binding NarL/FixJ family response regulator
MNLLIVDDHKGFRESLKCFLEFQPFISRVEEREDGDEVLPFLNKNGVIDCIIMDISMKRMDGLTSSKLVKEHFPNQVIIIMSMHDEENYSILAKEIGVEAFILKSSNLKELNNTLNQVVKK